MNKGSKAWMISDDRSIARLTKPSATTERGRAGREDMSRLTLPDQVIAANFSTRAVGPETISRSSF